MLQWLTRLDVATPSKLGFLLSCLAAAHFLTEDPGPSIDVAM